ncbi:hypothetical protein M3F63_07195 [Brachybacterium muris]|uniref:hypothetical protein n=1 Tax=Brachybacterium muris TaxID=219301 RepID=UPI00223BD439|nr:hypothetical protein [Brachybacterium muris]MCT2177454.1 hypothetical protein [Brachybacterium muris]
MILRFKHPDGPEKRRKFRDRADAAKYGIAHYLTANGYASRATAAHVASEFEKHGEASCDGIDFWTIPDKETAV